jgi:hypothetical protein
VEERGGVKGFNRARLRQGSMGLNAHVVIPDSVEMSVPPALLRYRGTMRMGAALATSARRVGAPSEGGARTFVTLRVYASCTQACGTTGATRRPKSRTRMGRGGVAAVLLGVCKASRWPCGVKSLGS